MTKFIKFLKFLRDIWLVFGIALAMFLGIEFGLDLFFRLKNSFAPSERYANRRAKADTYTDSSWARSYFSEYDAAVERSGAMRWTPYAYWRMAPHQGNYINVASDGIRRTHNNPAPENTAKTTSVFMLGGSTMWGIGVSDDSTIPSIFSKEINERREAFEVTNFGQIGYVSTQDVIALMLQLQRGNIPDVAVFYSGFNDVITAFRLKTPGLPYEEFNREIEFNLSKRREVRGVAMRYTVTELRTVGSFQRIGELLGLANGEVSYQRPLAWEQPIADKSALAQKVAEIYINNITMAHTLSRVYGFKCIFYLQPAMFYKQRLTEYERYAMDMESNADVMEFYKEVYASVIKRSKELKNDVTFHDMSLIFGQTQEPVFIDLVHFGESGNRVIARRMVEDFARLLGAHSNKQ